MIKYKDYIKHSKDIMINNQMKILEEGCICQIIIIIIITIITFRLYKQHEFCSGNKCNYKVS